MPATRSGGRPTARSTAPTSAPLPGATPRSVGRVASVLVATQVAPRSTAYAASARSAAVTPAPYPWSTATSPELTAPSAGGHRGEPGLDEGGGDTRSTDGEHGAARLDPLRQQPGGRLRARRDRRGLAVQAQRTQVRPPRPRESVRRCWWRRARGGPAWRGPRRRVGPPSGPGTPPRRGRRRPRRTGRRATSRRSPR